MLLAQTAAPERKVAGNVVTSQRDPAVTIELPRAAQYPSKGNPTGRSEVCTGGLAKSHSDEPGYLGTGANRDCRQYCC